jgi:hypothetical protein
MVALAAILGGLGWTQPAGWRYEAYSYEQGLPSAALVSASSGERVVLRPGDALEGFRVLTVNADRLTFRKDERVGTLLLQPAVAQREKNVLDRRIERLRAERSALDDVLSRLCRQAGLRLSIEGQIPGRLSVDFTGMTVREILDSLVRVAEIEYEIREDTLAVKPKAAEKTSKGK